jgi:sugar lactone lactonase YvrE
LTSQKLEFLDHPEKDKPENRFNDGKVDPKGRFWAGTLEILEQNGPLGALYRMGKDLKLEKMVDKVEVSNGLAWSLDHKTMYFIDSPRQRVDAFDYDVETGNLSNRRIAFETGKDLGYPDGMTIDKNGNLWVAHW